MTAPALSAELHERYVAPLDEQAPSGPNLEYDAEFTSLEQAAAGKAEQQFGDTIIPAEEPEWRVVFELADGLGARTRDLRVYTYRALSATRMRGFAGFVESLSMISTALETLWPSIHPELDPDDSEPAVMRLNALAPLVHESFIERLRATPLTSGPAALRVRDVELAFSKNPVLRDGESLPSADQVGQALAAIVAEQPDLSATLTGASERVKSIVSTIESNGAADSSPEFAPLSRLLDLISNASGAAASGGSMEAVEGDDAAGGAASSGGARSATPGEIRSRDDAIRALDAVADWITRNEPTNPAPLLIKRAKRLMTKNFLDIVRDLAPDSIGRVLDMVGEQDEDN
ncbi:type VI secretion system protein TssA [soil metagenome]